MRRCFITALWSCLVAFAISGAAAAQGTAWPTRPVRLIVTSAAGTGLDILARAFAERLSPALKQQVVIDNRPGANGLVATRVVRNAAPDGYTLLYSNASSTVMRAALVPTLGIDFTKDLAPVAVTVVGGMLLLAHPSLPASNLSELIAVVKAAPDRYSYASWGPGSNGHLTMEWLKTKTGMRIAHVPYKSMPVLLTELTSGFVPIGWVDPISPLTLIASGKLNAIAVNGPVRAPQLPALPTMGEQGHPFPAIGWQGIFAPARTPASVIQHLHAEINAVQGDPALHAMLFRNNVEAPPEWSTERFRQLIVEDLAAWRRIVADGNIKLE